MAYLGNDLQVAFPSYRNIDDISGSFNGVTTSFPLTVDGVAPIPAPINSQQCLISVNGVVQRPDDSGTEGFRLSGGNIIFASAPAGGVDFFGVILAGADYVNVGANFPSGTAAAPSITFDSDLDTGIYNPAGNQIGFSTAGTQRLVINSSGQISSGLGTAASPAFSFISDPNTGIYSPGADQLALSTNGTGRLFVDASGRVGVGTGGSTIQSALHVSKNGAEGFEFIPGDSSNTNVILHYNRSGAAWATNDQWAANHIFRIQSTEVARIDSSGRLGVGVSAPGDVLHVKGGSTYAGVIADNSAATGGGAFRAYRNGVQKAIFCADSWITGTSSDDAAIYADAGGGIKFYTNNSSTAKAVLTSGGSLGIGTSAPTSAKLDVRDDVSYPIRWGSTSAQFGELSYETGNCVIGATSGNKLTLRSAGTAAITIDTSQRVGIGTTSPIRPLSVSNGGAEGFEFGPGDTAGTNLTLHYNRSTSAYIGSINQANYHTWSAGGASEKMRIDTSGRLLVGTSTAPTINGGEYQFSVEGTSLYNSGVSLCTNSTSAIQAPMIAIARSRGTTNGSNTIVQSGDALGYLRFLGADGSTKGSVAAQILCEVDGTPGVGDMPGRLVFSTTADGASSPTERMRITADSNILIGKTTTSSSTAGARILSAGGSAGYSEWVRDGGNVMYINRMTDDGDLVKFAQADTQEGSISVSGTTVSYNGAHLSRWSQLPFGAERTEILRGSVLSNIDEMCEWGDEDNEQLNRMKVSDVEGDKNVAGVFQAWDDDDDTYTNDFYCAMTGDFIIRIGAGVTVERGDLLMSAGDGTAKPQDDDIIRSKTIAKVTSTNVSCTYDDGSYCVPCVLMAC